MYKTHRFQRVGAVVMALHDPSDVFLDAAKLSDYLGLEAASVIFFVLLLLSWGALRLVLLPFWVIRSILCGVFFPRFAYYVHIRDARLCIEQFCLCDPCQRCFAKYVMTCRTAAASAVLSVLAQQ